MSNRSKSSENRVRYSRHVALAELGEAGQARIERSRALIVGLGGGWSCSMRSFPRDILSCCNISFPLLAVQPSSKIWVPAPGTWLSAGCGFFADESQCSLGGNPSLSS